MKERTMTERLFPDLEIESSIGSFGGWLGWLGNGTEPNYATAALRWMSDQGDELPKELEELRDVLATFALPAGTSIVEAIRRVQGLERAFAEIAEHIDHGGIGGNTSHVAAIKSIVESCVKYSGCFDTQDAEPREGEKL